ncbi:MAG: VWA domain-containing protein [Albidovulum sp.]|nr:VWA domain-containing protein [Albidovulum sp.]
MPKSLGLDIPDNGKLADNIVHFARALRKAGITADPARAIRAVEAVRETGFENRSDFFWTLHSCFVNRPEQRMVFAQVFRLFWRDPRFLEHMMSVLLPSLRGVAEKRAAAAERRAAGALVGDAQSENPASDSDRDGKEVDFDFAWTVSSKEKFKTMDFEQMTGEEAAEAKKIVGELSLPADPAKSRRKRFDRRGTSPDWRATMRAASRAGGEIKELSRRSPRPRFPGLVALCDISGSMSAYSRILLHFLHAVANCKGSNWSKLHAFTIGTRLTNITRHLLQKDPDAALAAAGKQATDWEGGTRIGDCLRVYNRDWHRRIAGQGAVVLIISDGLDSGDPEILATEADRLRRSSRRLVWINPLLRWEGFAPRAAGVKALLPHVDCFRSAHNIASLAELAEAFSKSGDEGEKRRLLELLG